ncbi:hypothetical protein HK405_012969 [Cladochytrium tenue]|nr:hypothetical protein HK405_012969 [Cladochytrium tenue]
MSTPQVPGSAADDSTPLLAHLARESSSSATASSSSSSLVSSSLASFVSAATDTSTAASTTAGSSVEATAGDAAPAAATATAAAAAATAADTGGPTPIQDFSAFLQAAAAPGAQVVVSPRGLQRISQVSVVMNLANWAINLAWLAALAWAVLGHRRSDAELASGSCRPIADVLRFWLVKLAFTIAYSLMPEPRHWLVGIAGGVLSAVGFVYFWLSHFRIAVGAQCLADDPFVWNFAFWRLIGLYGQMLLVAISIAAMGLVSFRHLQVATPDGPGGPRRDSVLTDSQAQTLASRVQNLTTFLYRPPTLRPSASVPSFYGAVASDDNDDVDAPTASRVLGAGDPLTADPDDDSAATTTPAPAAATAAHCALWAAGAGPTAGTPPGG